MSGTGALAGQALRLGPMRLTVYGVAAAAGVLAGMGLSGRAARGTGLDPNPAWDTGLFAIMSCFVSSRLLLVLRDPVAFLHFPVLLLGLPSLTYGGMALAGVAVWYFLRRRRLPWRSMLDAFAPGGALLATFLELGHWLDGSEPGMPVSGAELPAQLRPVAAYGCLASVLLTILLWKALRHGTGLAASMGLLLGGALALGLDMLSLPSVLFGSWWLEPGEVIALLAMLAGAVLWTWAPRSTHAPTAM